MSFMNRAGLFTRRPDLVLVGSDVTSASVFDAFFVIVADGVGSSGISFGGVRS